MFPNLRTHRHYHIYPITLVAVPHNNSIWSERNSGKLKYSCLCACANIKLTWSSWLCNFLVGTPRDEEASASASVLSLLKQEENTCHDKLQTIAHVLYIHSTTLLVLLCSGLSASAFMALLEWTLLGHDYILASTSMYCTLPWLHLIHSAILYSSSTWLYLAPYMILANNKTNG